MSRLVRVENRLASPLEENGFDVYRGWNNSLATQLVERSLETEMLEHVPRDHAERFISRDRAHEWYAENDHTVYALGERATLAGVAWFTKQPLESQGADYTFAIRMYEKARGRGFAGAFMMAAHADFESHAQYEGPIWLETDENNLPARRLYERFGYNGVSSDGDRLKMVRLGRAPVRESMRPVICEADET